MANASVIYGVLAGAVVAILYIIFPTGFLDDLRVRFSWTKGETSWTRARLRLSSTRFRTSLVCKTTISTAGQALAGWEPEPDDLGERFLGRTEKSALSYKRGLHRWGERPVAHAAVGSIQLKPTQQRAVAALRAGPASELTRAQYEKLAGVSRSQAAYDLAELVEVGILERFGNGRATRYRLARVGGMQRHWTSDRIRTELDAFCGAREVWPSAADFRAAGRGDLYVAASRYGGIAYWTEALGFTRPSGRVIAAPEASPFRTKLAWAGGGALAALGLAAAVGTIFVTLNHDGAPVATLAAKPGRAAPTKRATHESLRAVRARAAKPSLARRVHSHRTGGLATAGSRLSGSRSLPTHWSSPQSSSTSTVGTRTFSAVTPTPSWPAPLGAPSGPSAPAPLKAP